MFVVTSKLLVDTLKLLNIEIITVPYQDEFESGFLVFPQLVYFIISELMKNKHFYYFSSIGMEYCHWTETGKEALHAYMELMTYKFYEAEIAELDRRAKELVIKGLKGEP
jgi:hypothetical protein